MNSWCFKCFSWSYYILFLPLGVKAATAADADIEKKIHGSSIIFAISNEEIIS